MKKYLICILQHRNVNYSITAFLHLHAALRLSKSISDQCKIVFACTTHGSSELHNLAKIFHDVYDIDVFECEGYYPEKLQAVFNEYSSDIYQYFIKHDEDIFISSISWLKLLSKIDEVLADDNNLLTTVNLSTGIPSWYYFAKAFLCERDQQIIYDKLAHDEVPNHIWGNDYGALNTYIKSHPSWNENGYWGIMNNLGYHYRGLHPIRVNLAYALAINETIICRYSEFQTAEVCESFKKVQDRYFCNSFFVINYKRYQQILQNKSLYIDVFDEVSINRYLLINNLNLCFLENSLGVHIIYNSAYDQSAAICSKKMNGREIEKYFLNCYLLNITNYLKDIGDKKINDVKIWSPSFSEIFSALLGRSCLYTLFKKLRIMRFYIKHDNP